MSFPLHLLKVLRMTSLSIYLDAMGMFPFPLHVRDSETVWVLDLRLQILL